MMCQDHFHVVDGFSDVAEAARRRFEEHFASPATHTLRTHGVWNYWHVPDLYTYLRADPRRILSAAVVDAFLAQLAQWSVRTLGCPAVGEPYLSLYVSGCRQNLHNDAANGRWAYVWSLTAPNAPLVGGATILLRPEPYWGTRSATRPVAGAGVYDRVTPDFNRLVVFDDRLHHGLEPVESGMAPLNGRVVLHGHLSEGEPWASGGLAGQPAAVHSVLRALADQLAPAALGFSGVICLQLAVSPDGKVSGAQILTERLIADGVVRVPAGDLAERVVESARLLRFAAVAEPSVVIASVRFPIGPSRADR